MCRLFLGIIYFSKGFSTLGLFEFFWKDKEEHILKS